jgi:hypothetical protein
MKLPAAKTFLCLCRFLLLATLAVVGAFAPTTAHADDIPPERIVDVLVVYTPAVRQATGGYDAVKAEINAMISETNRAYADSGITAKLRLAGWREVNYTESPFSYDDDLDVLSDLRPVPSMPGYVDTILDGVIDEVHDLRAEVGADTVVLFREGAAAGTAGLAYVLGEDDNPDWYITAFAVVGRRLNYYTFAHEIGHNMGLAHDRANSSISGIYSYSYGYNFSVPSGRYFGTIMSYPGDRTIGRFSNPDLSIEGVPTGKPAGNSLSADAARTLNQTIPKAVSHFYDPVLPAKPVISPEGGTIASGGSVPVIITEQTPFCTIYYTLDGTEPDTTKTAYTGPFSLTASTTVKACAYKDGYPLSPVATAVFTANQNAPAPTWQITGNLVPTEDGGDGKAYLLAASVALSATGSNDVIYYTLDGTEPAIANAAVYVSPIALTATTTLNARIWRNGRLGELATFQVAVWQVLAPPQISPASGTEFIASVSVNIAAPATAPTAIIRYTLDKSAVVPSSLRYTAPLILYEDTTIKARAFLTGYAASETVSAIFRKHLPPAPSPAINVSGTPAASGGADTYQGPATISFTKDAPSDIVRYTLDGSDVTEDSPEYTTPFLLTHTSTVTARVWRTGYGRSEAVSRLVTINPVAVAPVTFSLAGGVWREGVDRLTITCTTAGAQIRYTLDGSEPTETSALYTAPLELLAAATVKARAFHSDYLAGETASVVFDGYIFAETLAPVVFAPPAGLYADEVTVTLTCATAGALIRYTLDGSDVTADSPSYTAPLVLTANTRVKALAFKARANAAPQTTADYTVRPTPPAPPANIRLDGEKIGDDATNTFRGPAQIVFLADREGDVIRFTLDGSDVTESSPEWTAPYYELTRSATVKARVYRAEYKPGPQLEVAVVIVPIHVAAPVISPNGGEFAQSIRVVISCETTGALIRYTLDGSDVTDASTLYTGAFSIFDTLVLKTRAFKTDYLEGTQAEAVFTRILPPAPSPLIVLEGERVAPENGGGADTFAGSVSVTLVAHAAGDIVRYTLDGAEVSADSPHYTAPFTLTESKTIKARIWRAGSEVSATAEAQVVVMERVAVPIITPDGGEFSGETAVGIYSATTGAEIRYTLDGAAVTANSPLYTGAFILGHSATLRARAFKAGCVASGETVAVFVRIAPPAAAPTASIAGTLVAPENGGDGNAYAGNATVSLLSPDPAGVIRYTLDGGDVTADSPEYTGAFALEETATVRARVWREGQSPSDTAAFDVVIWGETAAPVFENAGGVFLATARVALTCADPAATIRYTLDGSGVTVGSLEYTGAFDVAATTTVRARAFAPNRAASVEVAATFEVRQPEVPAFTTQPLSQDADVGSAVVLRAAASGFPTPELQWRFNGVAIAGATGNVFNIAAAAASDAGAYDVVAQNSAGTAVSNAAVLTVGVRQTWVITRQPVAPKDAVVPGQALVLSVTVSGGSVSVGTGTGTSAGTGVSASTGADAGAGTGANVGVSADLSYQWFFNGTPIAGATRPVFAIAAARPADTGRYTVEVSDTRGRRIVSAAADVAVGQWVGVGGGAGVGVGAGGVGGDSGNGNDGGTGSGSGTGTGSGDGSGTGTGGNDGAGSGSTGSGSENGSGVLKQLTPDVPSSLLRETSAAAKAARDAAAARAAEEAAAAGDPGEEFVAPEELGAGDFFEFNSVASLEIISATEFRAAGGAGDFTYTRLTENIATLVCVFRDDSGNALETWEILLDFTAADCGFFTAASDLSHFEMGNWQGGHIEPHAAAP